MSRSIVPGPWSINRRMAARLAGAAALVVVVVALVGPAVLSTRPAATPSGTEIAVLPSATVPTNSVGPTAGPTESAPTEPSGAWEDLEVPPFEPAAAFAANDSDRLGVGTDSSFTLRSLTAIPATDLAQRLRVDPPLTFAVEGGATPDLATLRPSSPLAEGVKYHVQLDAPDGSLAGSWAFTARAPLHVVETLPENQATQVPVNTGIEITFDQDGTRDVANHVSITPAVPGRFEQHDRTWAFVPDTRLAPGTIYTVSVRAGIGLAGSSQTLEEGVTFRFETALPSEAAARIHFDRVMFEVRPGERPVIPLGDVEEDEEGTSTPSTVTVDVHSLPTMRAAVDAGYALSGPDSWALNATTAVVDTSHLTRVARVEGTILDSPAGPFVRLPFRPDPGEYILTIVQKGPPEQLLLQSTDLGAYALTGTSDFVVWANDMTAHRAVRGASVAIANGPALGTTNAAGLLRAATPASLLDTTRGSDEEPVPHFLTITAADGRHAIVPVGLRLASYSSGYEGPYGWEDPNGDNVASWWLLLRTDRDAYRQTDTINVYGMIRARADRSVPGGLELRLRPESAPFELAIVRQPVQATDRGAFSGSLHITDLPRGSYMVDLMAGSKRVASAWAEVTEIRKPAYRIDIETDRHIYVLGQQVKLSATAAFYDGTPIPGLDLRFSAFDKRTRATTGALGNATARLRAASDWLDEGWTEEYVGVAPVHPEEGQIEGDGEVVLVPSRVWLSTTGSIRDGKVSIQGTLSWTDIKGMEATLDAGRDLDWETDGPGRPIASGKVRAEVIHIVPVQTGTTYDFVEKKVIPVYGEEPQNVSLGTRILTSASDGSFRLSVPAPVVTDDYKVILRASDPEGRTFRQTLWVSAPIQTMWPQAPYLEQRAGCGPRGLPAELDQPFTVTMHQGTGAVASGGRFLFLVSEQGRIEATVQDAATFSRTMRDADLPGFTIRGVWLRDQGYAVSDARAVITPNDKRIAIRLAPDQGRYRPGGNATIAITTTGPNGKPVAADVIVQGVDEKLFTQGLAADADPVPELMQATDNGFLQSYATHSVPGYGEGDGCGGAGGGGREDFRDVVTFQQVRTDARGRGSVAFRLPDDLTSWHITATAVDGALDSGYAAVQVPVGLPFFVDAVLAPQYLAGERPVLTVRAFGEALPAAARVRFTVEARTLGMTAKTVSGRPYVAVRVPLPELTAGDHRIRIAAETIVAGKTYTDAVVRTVHVGTTRLSGLVAAYDVLDSGFTPRGGPGLTTYAITDAGRGRLLSILQALASDRSGRFDKQAAAEAARQILIDEFGFKAEQLAATGFDVSRYQREGLALLSYGSPDLFLTARAALVMPEVVNDEELRAVLSAWATDADATRERRIASLAGSAGLGENVLADLRAFAPSSLTVREQLWLALGLAAAGDEGAARDIERALLEAAGQRLGPWARLDAGTKLADTLEASGLLLMLAGKLGDPVAHDVARYLQEVPSKDLVFPIEQLGYVRGFLERLPRESARFAWTVAGARHVVTLAAGGGYTLVLTSDQRATLKLERLTGDLTVVTTWTSADIELPESSTISVTRRITPAGTAPSDRLVRVSITVDFGAKSAPGCYRLTDLAPSGLTPVAATAGWPEDADGEYSTANWPYSAVGQEVSWCANPKDSSHRYTYTARVVSPGTYRWEPALLQFELDPRIGASTKTTRYTIR